METIDDFGKRIKAMRLEVAKQNKAADEFATSFNYSKQQLIQHDQIACLQTLRSRILEEVEGIKRLESAAQIGSSQGKMLSGLAAFALSGLFAAMNNRNDAFGIGIKSAQSIFNKEIPFGSVFVAIGKGGLPEDVEVVSISRLARESDKSELDVRANLQADKCLLMTPEAFIKVLDEAERGICDGTISLPIDADKLKRKSLEVSRLRLS